MTAPRVSRGIAARRATGAQMAQKQRSGGPVAPETVGGVSQSDQTLPGPLRGDSELELILTNRIERAGLPLPERQFRFCPTRRWRADFAYPSAMLLIEVDGGAYVGGRHTRGAGFEADCEKASTAAALGFRVVRVTGRMIKDGRAVLLIRQALEHLTSGDG